MAVDYDTIAKEIVGNAIRSVIFVDDKIALPFEDAAEPDQIDLPKRLYHSFVEHNCGLDFYRFNEGTDWKPHTDYFFKGRDLFILDWQLNNAEPRFKSTLEVLAESIRRESLHFVCIYTDAPKKDFLDIIYSINAYYAPFKSEELDKSIAAIRTLLQQSDLEMSKVFDIDVLARLKELALYRDRISSTFKDLKELLTKNSSKEILQNILSLLKPPIYKNQIYGFCGLGFRLNGETIGSDASLRYEARNFTEGERYYLVVNHTLIMVMNKADIRSEILYEEFSKALIESSGNFLTLMGLEMRNLFRESSAFIGKDIDSINELAFFHHRKEAMPKEAFYDFLKELWKGQASSFLYHKGTQPRLFDALDDYMVKKGIEEKLKTFMKETVQHEQHIGKLNYYYNTLHINRPEKDKIRFGDIFRKIKQGETESSKYLICITPHCDCLRPEEKIDDHFFFVEGDKDSLSKGLKDGDAGYTSFILSEGGKIVVIRWLCKPFTVHIPSERNDIDKPIACKIGETGFMLGYQSTLKENYAQRIANQSFSYSNRVGIYFASTRQDA